MTARTALVQPLLLAALALGVALPIAAQEAAQEAAPGALSDAVDESAARTMDGAADGATDARAARPAARPAADGVGDYVEPATAPAAATETAEAETDAPEPPAAAAEPAPAPPALPAGILATVNERPVPELSLESIVRQLSTEGEAPDRERILDELIDLEILTQEAERMKLDRRPEIAAALQLQYTQTMANAYLAAVGDEMEFSERELRAEYERQIANVDQEEFRASHILLDTEEEARAVIEELANGADFAALAETRSTDPAGQNNGGDLGWFQGGSTMPEFTAALETMEVGASSEEPVRTDFGYHVILLAEKRSAAMPDFESVRPGLTNLATRNRLAERVEALRGQADVIRR